MAEGNEYTSKQLTRNSLFDNDIAKKRDSVMVLPYLSDHNKGHLRIAPYQRKESSGM